MYLSEHQIEFLGQLLKAFFSLPYSTDLDGKDAETLIKIVKGITTPPSKRKELFDIVDKSIGYSVKTLKKSPASLRVDLQEQRLGDVEDIRGLRNLRIDNASGQGQILLDYMLNRIHREMSRRKLDKAYSLILLKDWDSSKRNFHFRYWEEDFLEYVETLYKKNVNNEIEWITQGAGLHGRDKLRQDAKGQNIRLIRMHYKHNQIFTDHDIPANTANIRFASKTVTWPKLLELLQAHESIIKEDFGDLFS